MNFRHAHNYRAALDAGGVLCHISGVLGPSRVSAAHSPINMKTLLLCLFLPFLTAIPASCEETNVLAGQIKAILPDRDWTIADRGDVLKVTGPEVKTLWQVNLPPEPDEQKLWRDYATTQRVEVYIEFQGPISDEDVAKLKNLKEQFEKIMQHANRGINNQGRDGDMHVRKFGFVRIPDYRSSSASLFVSDNVAAGGNSPLAVDPAAVQKTVRKIYGIIERYCKSDTDSAKKNARHAGPGPEE
jgi:hypothetical protein